MSELKALDSTEVDYLLEAAAKYDLLAEQYSNGSNVERAMVDLLEKVGTVLRRCHKTIRASRPVNDVHQDTEADGIEYCGKCGQKKGAAF